MSDSRDHRCAPGEAPGDAYWHDWFARHAPSAAGSSEQWRRLAGQWHAAIDGWWASIGDCAPADARDALRRCTDQGKALFELAEGVTRDGADAATHIVAGEDHTALWRLPLEMWKQATETFANVSGDARPPRTLGAYRKALGEYGEMLRGVGADTLRDVSHAWRARRDAHEGEAGLRALFDTCVDVGECRYQELVSSDVFAETGGRLVNTFVDLLADMEGASGGARAAPDDGDRNVARPRSSSESRRNRPDVDPVAFMNRLGIAPQTALAELRAFGEKLNVTLATLREVGPVDVGTSAREVVLREGKLTLYRYRATSGKTNPVPVLIVYALANRPYMMDLEPGRSLIRALVDAGLDVYLIDWGYPGRDDRGLDLTDYVVTRIGKCVQAVSEQHGMESISLLGVCQGGTFSLCYSALHPERVRNLVLMVTPVDFHTPDNLLAGWLRHVDVDRMVDVMGNVPGALLNWAFVSMKPLKLTGQKYLDMLELAGDSEKLGTFLRMEKWIHDNPDQAGECFRQFARDIMQQNKLVDGALQIGARRVDLRNVTMPILNIYATQDHIVPPAAALALGDRVACEDYSTYAFEGGHIGIYVSARAQREVPPEIARWLHARCRPAAK